MRIAQSLVCSALSVVALSACSTDLDEVDSGFFSTGVNFIRVDVFDAQTGAVIDNATVEIFAGPNTFVPERDGSSYIFNRLPGGTLPVFAEAPGYIQFIGNLTGLSSSSATSTNRTFQNRSIALFPVGDAGADVIVSVVDNEINAPVEGVEVVASFNINAALSGVENFQNPIFPSGTSFGTVLTATTNSSGEATLPAADLVLGATYSVDVFGALSGGRFLRPVTNQSFTVGTTFNPLLVFLAEPTTAVVALSANTDEDGPATQTQLVVNFPYAVEICSDPADHDAILFASNTDLDLDVNTIDPDNPTDESLSEDGRTLTLSFNLSSTDDDDALGVQFLDYAVSPVGSSSCEALNTVEIRDTNVNVNTTITVR